MTRKKKKPEAKPMEENFESFGIQQTQEVPIEVSTPKTYKVKVTHPSLRIRRAPNTQAEILGLITDEGIYEILDEVNGWGKIGDDKWIMLSYTQVI